MIRLKLNVTLERDEKEYGIVKFLPTNIEEDLPYTEKDLKEVVEKAFDKFLKELILLVLERKRFAIELQKLMEDNNGKEKR